MDIPTEVLDHIISFLQSDQASLRACCKSHTVLSQLAEPYFYANIFLGEKNYGQLREPEFSLPSDLFNFLSKTPHVTHYIRGLEIQFNTKSQSNMDCLLKETSAILPMLSSLRTISFDILPLGVYTWKGLPECFRLAFLNCLHSPSMRDVSISRFVDFPFIHVLNGAYKTITKLAVSNSLASYINPDDAPYPIQSRPFESLCISDCDNLFLSTFITQIERQELQFQSLEFSAYDLASFYTFSRLVTCSSNSLVSLDLVIDHLSTTPAFRHESIILVKLSTLPHLERFRIRSKIEYISRFGLALILSIPQLRHFFSTNPSSGPPRSSLKHVTFDFRCIVKGQRSLLPLSSFSKAFCLDFVQLLSSISTFAESSLSNPIQVDLYLHGSDKHDTPSDPNWRVVPMPLHFLLSPLYQCEELMEFVSRGMLSIQPLYSNI